MAKLYITQQCLEGEGLPPGSPLPLPGKGQPLEGHLSPCWSLQALGWEGARWKGLRTGLRGSQGLLCPFFLLHTCHLSHLCPPPCYIFLGSP